MAESPIEKLKRLKLEREQKNDQLKQSSTLEAVQEPTGGNSVGTVALGSAGQESGTRDRSASPKPVQVEVSVSSGISDPDSSGVAEVKPLEVKAEPAAKPMTAMERLRALKSGSASPAVAETKAPIQTVLEDLPKVVKERKTHPIAMEMAELEAALDAQVPGFVSILSTIHKKLKADPNVVTLLDDEEIAVIVAGLEKHTNVTIVAPSAVKAAKSKARKEPVGAGDL